jgi:uncharacterized protein (DUF2126 family)
MNKMNDYKAIAIEKANKESYIKAIATQIGRPVHELLGAEKDTLEWLAKGGVVQIGNISTKNQTVEWVR